MATLYKESKALGWSEVGLIPSIGQVSSRSNIEIEGHRIIISSVSSIVSKELLKEMTEVPIELRPSIAIPRTKDAISYLDYALKLNLEDWVIPCIGLDTPELEDYIVDKGRFKKVLVDIAHGTTPQTQNLGIKLHNKFGEDVKIICGSVSTQEGAAYLDRMGFDIIRSGIGTSSSICSTAFQTGVRVGAFTEIMNLYGYVEGTDLEILADGGMVYVGDIAKAFLAGASYCMGATMFANLKNAKCNLDGSFKLVGMSNKEKGVRAGKTTYDESFTTQVSFQENELVSLYDKLMEIWGGLRSSISYCGFDSLKSAIGNGEFIELGQPLTRAITEIKK